MSATKSVNFGTVKASVTLSGENPVVRVLRKGSEVPETFERVSRVVQLRRFDSRDLSQGSSFMDSMLERKAAEFGPSILIVKNGSSRKRIDDAVRLEIVKGVIEGLESTDPV
jgi:hypothetical protein